MKKVEVQKEYERIKELFSGVDEKQMQLIDGALWEAARLRVELNDLNKIIKETGLLKTKPGDPSMQKELPVSKLVVKVRANYLNYIAKLSNVLGKNIEEEEDDLGDYE
ncbi:zinc-binding protein [Clostridium paraputrificum]|uniref:zinc-binding protein n=1 Tax=Clostridium paraputrificum TaxID=29363 RepID=UPI00374F9D2E